MSVSKAVFLHVLFFLIGGTAERESASDNTFTFLSIIHFTVDFHRFLPILTGSIAERESIKASILLLFLRGMGFRAKKIPGQTSDWGLILLISVFRFAQSEMSTSRVIMTV